MSSLTGRDCIPDHLTTSLCLLAKRWLALAGEVEKLDAILENLTPNMLAVYANKLAKSRSPLFGYQDS